MTYILKDFRNMPLVFYAAQCNRGSHLSYDKTLYYYSLSSRIII
ncbi:protein of unknown function [Candidatus Nitrosacidococcus tergens]|uniref:Uncharacterized protein n=1 Tax=Candidatus Nitrosacidococcus tergens TaxID=553981 RepID=A0A7G1QBW9_9GAMM|nr:protein of unknown function [Candidatus Nitrosacidococcus tergens]